ncbi:N-acetylmuramoyl-L-alanine amidase [Fontibacillus phaseoli]|uniref:N-acetylmuramoyl-L-alanine amidase n=1 Tax=Fontibacillus phaseoli TaxID=1416533 RepID=A0A369BLS6_9BACL|nr:N-acetylmuramoyl-L-alanine amidase [Fontibacillus phaseoli]RCX21546.1 N-acetylmuramoyl-L-alanine amidase [Fontibacillus phaseoli]
MTIKTYLILLLFTLTAFHVWIAPVAASADGNDNDLRHAFPEPVILIDVGHGGIDGGTSFGDLLEKDINLAVGRRLYMILRSHGYRTILNRTGDYTLSDDNRWLNSRSRHMRDLAQRKELSEQVPASIVVSVHVNWGRNKAKRGPLVLHQEEGRSAALAGSIQHALDDLYDLPRTTLPELGKPFYLLRHIDSPAVIVETGFISNSEDRAMLISTRGQQKIAEAIYAGIAEYFTVM